MQAAANAPKPTDPSPHGRVVTALKFGVPPGRLPAQPIAVAKSA